MKIRIVLSCGVLAVSIAILLGPTVFAQGKDHNVIIKANPARIIIPGTEISQADQKTINNILKQCGDSSLYKIQVFEKGKAVGRPRGTMKIENVLTEGVTKAQIANDVQTHGISNWSFVMDGSVSSPTPTPTKCSGEELVKRLTPIFKKYSK
jgi:hypothetical protein